MANRLAAYERLLLLQCAIHHTNNIIAEMDEVEEESLPCIMDRLGETRTERCPKYNNDCTKCIRDYTNTESIQKIEEALKL